VPRCDAASGCPEAANYAPPPGVAFSRVYPYTQCVPSQPNSNGGQPIVSNQLIYEDLNGDGYADLLRTDGSDTNGLAAWLFDPSGNSSGVVSGTHWLPDARFTPTNAMRTAETTLVSSGCYQLTTVGTRLADVDGNGTLDIVHAFAGTHTSWPSVGTFSDRVAAYNNGKRGHMDFKYTGAAAQRSAALESLAASDAAAKAEDDGIDFWPSVPVVTQVTKSGLNIPTGGYVTTYAYARERFCPIHRSLLGFRASTVGEPDGSIRRTFFWQQHSRAGQPSRQEVLTSSGNLLALTTSTWAAIPITSSSQITGAAPGVQVGRLTNETESTYYGTGDLAPYGTGSPSPGAIRSVTYSYNDSYGYNFTSQIEVDRPTGNIVVVRNPTASGADTTNWIVDLVGSEVHHEGTASGIVDRSIHYSYDGSGRLTGVTRDVQARVASPSSTTSVGVQYGYDAYGNVTSYTDEKGRVETLAYDGDALPSATTPQGFSCPSVTSATHTVLYAVQDTLGGLSCQSADLATGAVLQRTRFNGDQATIAVDGFTRPTSVSVTPLGGAATLLESRVYTDAVTGTNPQIPPHAQRIESVGDAASTTVRTAQYFDSFSQLMRSVSPNASGGYLGRAILRDYAGRPTNETDDIPCSDADCSTMTGSELPAVATAYDSLGRPTSITRPQGITSLTYNQVVAVQSPSYDVVLVQDPLSHYTQRILDGDRVASVDECGTSASCSAPDVTSYAYEPTGDVAGITDPAGHKLLYSYDTLGRTTAVNDPDAGLSTMTYEPTGTLSTVQNARQQGTTVQTSFGYDQLDRLISITRPANERSVTITYDPVTRRRSSVSESGTGGYSATYAYDTFGLIQQKTQTLGGVKLVALFSHDLLGRVSAIAYPAGATVVYKYSGAYLNLVCELESGATDCDSGSFNYISSSTYDSIGREQDVQTAPGKLHYDYDATTYRLSGITLTSGSTNLIALTYQYDGADNILQITDNHASVSSDVDSSGGYTYDSRNRLASYTRGSVSSYFTYDSIGNLTGRSVSAAGQTNQNYQDPLHAHGISSRSDGTSYTYDADGNMIHRGVQYLNYDSANRLSCVASSQASATGACGNAGDVTFQYDVDGNRIYTSVSGSSSAEYDLDDLFEWYPGTGTAVAHIYAFGKRLASKTMTGVTLRSSWEPWVWPLPIGPRPLGYALALIGLVVLALLAVRGGALEQARRRPVPALVSLALMLFFVAPEAWAGGPGPSGTLKYRFYFSDHLGSGVLVTNETGTVVDRRAFEPFGQVVAESGPPGQGPTETTEQVFTGQRLENTSGLYDFRARWYDPTSGRFLSVDPIVQSVGDPQTLNGYGYVRNNPVNSIDPSGLGFFSFFKRLFHRIHDIFVRYVLPALEIELGIVLIAVAAITLFTVPEAGPGIYFELVGGLSLISQGIRAYTGSDGGRGGGEPVSQAAATTPQYVLLPPSVTSNQPDERGTRPAALPIEPVAGRPMRGSNKPFNDGKGGPEDVVTQGFDFGNMIYRILLNQELDQEIENDRRIAQEEQLFRDEDAYAYKVFKYTEGSPHGPSYS